MKRFLIALIAVLVIAILVVLISRTQKTSTNDVQDMVLGEAIVDSYSISLLETFPIQVQVTAEGVLPDGCTDISGVNQERLDDTFFANVQTQRPVDAICTQAIVPFTENFLLNGTTGLPAGEYFVDINGQVKSFTFDVDNFLTDFDPQK